MMSIRNVILKSDESPEVSQEQDEEVRTYKEARNKKERERYRDISKTIEELKQTLELDVVYQAQVLEKALMEMKKLKEVREAKLQEREMLCNLLGFPVPPPSVAPLHEEHNRIKSRRRVPSPNESHVCFSNHQIQPQTIIGSSPIGGVSPMHLSFSNAVYQDSLYFPPLTFPSQTEFLD